MHHGTESRLLCPLHSCLVLGPGSVASVRDRAEAGSRRRSVAMRRARFVRGTLGVLLAGWVGSAGCTHNYYYGAVPVACAPGTAVVPGSVSYGSVCEVPAQVVGGGTVVASSPGIRSSVTTTAP